MPKNTPSRHPMMSQQRADCLHLRESGPDELGSRPITTSLCGSEGRSREPFTYLSSNQRLSVDFKTWSHFKDLGNQGFAAIFEFINSSLTTVNSSTTTSTVATTTTTSATATSDKFSLPSDGTLLQNVKTGHLG